MWEKLINRITQIVKKEMNGHIDGHAIVVIRVVVDSSGQPRCWVVPRITRLEPSSGNWIDLLSS